MVDAVRLEGVVKQFGRVRALNGLTVVVAPGQVYGLLGPNGAGKTTTIRLLLDLIRPMAGKVTVLGMDPRTAGAKLHQRIGYVPGDFRVDGRQTPQELLDCLGNMRRGASATRVDDLVDRFDLRTDVPISTLSRGNRQKVALVQAFMHEPDLLILDEPTSGLDPFMQKEFGRLIREAAGAGRTVLMSSHVMSEVQQNADRVGIVRNGQLVVEQDVQELRKSSARRVEIVLADGVAIPEFTHVSGVSNIDVEGRTITLRLTGAADEFVKALALTTVVSLTADEPELEDLFFAAERGEGDFGDPHAA